MGKISIFLSGIAVVISLIVLFFQFSPYLTVAGVSGGIKNDGKVYFYIRNTGQLPSYYIKGRFVITSNKETVPMVAKEPRFSETVPFDTGDSVIFYPTGGENVLPVVYLVNTEKIDKKDNIFLSIYFEYPRFWKLPIFRNRYEGVFQYTEGVWVTNSQTILPKFFSNIFRALREGYNADRYFND